MPNILIRVTDEIQASIPSKFAIKGLVSGVGSNGSHQWECEHDYSANAATINTDIRQCAVDLLASLVPPVIVSTSDKRILIGGAV